MSSITSNVSDLISSAAATQPYAVSAQVNNDGTGIVDGSSTSSGTDAGFSSAASKSAGLGKNDFLQLLVTQLRYQDPLSPMDNTQFISQMAQFSALESMNNVESAVNKLNGSFTSSVDAQNRSADSISNSSAISLIGKTVRMQIKNVQWNASAGEIVRIPVYLGAHNQANVSIKDASGAVVSTVKAAGKDSTNTVYLAWDGRTDDDGVAPAGTYTVYIDGQESDESLYAFEEGEVQGVRFTKEDTMLAINGTEVPLGSLLDVAGGSASAQGANGSLSPATAAALIGKEVRVLQNTISFSQGSASGVGIKVNAPAGSQVAVKICSASGKSVQTVTGTADSDGVAFLEWNGSTSSGDTAPTGEYGLQVVGQSQDPALYAFVDGTVEGVSTLGGTTLVRIAGRSFTIGSIVDIAEAT